MLGATLRGRRKALGLTVDEVTASVDTYRRQKMDGRGCSKSMVEAVESGQRRPSTALLRSFIAVLGFDEDEAAELEEDLRDLKRSRAQDEVADYVGPLTEALQGIERRMAAIEELLRELRPGGPPQPNDGDES